MKAQQKNQNHTGPCPLSRFVPSVVNVVLFFICFTVRGWHKRRYDFQRRCPVFRVWSLSLPYVVVVVSLSHSSLLSLSLSL